MKPSLRYDSTIGVGERAKRYCSNVGLAAFLAVSGGVMAEGLIAPKIAYAQEDAIYRTKNDPLRANMALADIAGSLEGSARDKAKMLFKLLAEANGMRVEDGEGRPPRIATGAFVSGGDCSELALIAVSVLKEAGVPGGALIVHFESAPQNLDHMVAFVQDGKKKIIIDLQTDGPGKTAQGKYKVLHTLTYDQTAYMYHREWADYLRDNGDPEGAIAAYKRAAELYDKDAYVYQNLGVLYEAKDDIANSTKNFRMAARLDSKKYGKDVLRGSYNEELAEGQKAVIEKQWADCVEHFQNALDSGEKLSADERKAIESNRDLCERKK